MDYLKRFDWGLAARIRRMGADELAALLAERFPAWQAAGRRPFSEALRLVPRGGRTFAEVLAELLSDGATLTELQNDAVYDLCLYGEDVRLDEAGSCAEALLSEPEAAVSSLEVLPGTDEEVFLLLRPRHVEAMLRALEEAADPGEPAPDGGRHQAIARLRDACASGPNLLVAYCFDC
jgi:hypothetical protein